MDVKKLAKIHKALSNENRLEIYLGILKEHEKQFQAKEECNCRISTIIDQLNIGAPTISHHLKELVNAELIETRREGRYVIATINETTLAWLREEFK